MVTFFFFEFRFVDRAIRLSNRAPWVKSTTSRRIRGTWNVALENDPLPSPSRFRERNGRNQRLCVGMLWAFGDDSRVTNLDQLPEIHDPHPIADVGNNRQIVSDEEVG